MESDLEWLSASAVRAKLIAAGIGDADLFLTLARAALFGGLIASGYCDLYDHDEHHALDRRKPVSQRLWRIFERADPTFEDDCPRGGEFARFVQWEQGVFSWTFETESGRNLQETWRSVHFESISFATLLEQVKQRSNSGDLQDHQIADWIRGCGTENSKIAWALYRREFGARTGKKARFEELWGLTTGGKSRGRPRKSVR